MRDVPVAPALVGRHPSPPAGGEIAVEDMFQRVEHTLGELDRIQRSLLEFQNWARTVVPEVREKAQDDHGHDADYAPLTHTHVETDITDLGDYVLESLFDANTILTADSDNTPQALTVAEERLVGRITSGVITALTQAQVRTFLGWQNMAEQVNTNVNIDGGAIDGTAIGAAATANGTFEDLEAGGDFLHSGTNLAFFGGTPGAKPTITGARDNNAALADLLTDLAALGLLTDSTTAT